MNNIVQNNNSYNLVGKEQARDGTEHGKVVILN